MYIHKQIKIYIYYVKGVDVLLWIVEKKYLQSQPLSHNCTRYI